MIASALFPFQQIVGPLNRIDHCFHLTCYQQTPVFCEP